MVIVIYNEGGTVPLENGKQMGVIPSVSGYLKNKNGVTERNRPGVSLEGLSGGFNLSYT